MATTYPLLSCGTNITRYVWGLDISGQSGGRASSQAEMQGAGGVSGLCAVFPDNGITPHYPAYNANGNITEYVDFTGNTIAHYAYDAFGNTVNKSGSMADDFKHRFSTKYWDAETGLYNYGERYYKSLFGRFISRDPIEERGGLNLYGFCANDPVNKVDYLGMKPEKACKKNGVEITLIFNGKTLSGSGFSTPAVSGVPVSVSIKDTVSGFWPTYITRERTAIFDYSIERQKIQNVGPIPLGNYWISVDETNSRKTSPRHKYKTFGWGDYSWFLEIEQGTETYGRGGFFIHGGAEWGSAGCIDIRNGDKLLAKFIEDLCDCYIPVKVSYAAQQETFKDTSSFYLLPFTP